MAMAWVTEVTNHTQHDVKIRQYDPTWHPEVSFVTDPHRYTRRMMSGDEWVVYGMSQSNGNFGLANVKYCAVPWADFGRLEIQGPTDTVRFIVGPSQSDSKYDYLRCFKANDDIVFETKIGGRGGGWWAGSIDFHLALRDDMFKWTVWSSNAGAQGFIEGVKQAFEDNAQVLGKIIGIFK